MSTALPTGVYSHSAPTSLGAAALVADSTAATQNRQIMRTLWLAGIHGCTRDELQTQCEMSGDSVRPRVMGLTNRGLIERSGEIRKTAKGRDAEVLVLTVAGKQTMGKVP
jgi:hypothetical protein